MQIEEITEHEYVEILEDRLQKIERVYRRTYKLLMRGTEEIDGYRTRFYIEREDDGSNNLCYERIKKEIGFR